MISELKIKESKLKIKRKKERKTQKDVGEAANVDRAYISMLENDKKTPSLKVAQKIAKYFKVSTDDLFDEIDM